MHQLSEKPQPPGAGRPAAALRNVFMLAALTWLLVSAAYHGAVSPAGAVTGIDFGIFYHAAGRLNAGQPLYQPHGELYAYSPLLAQAVRPLARLPFEKALKVWFFFETLCLVGAVAIYAAAARMTWRDGAPLGLMLLAGFHSWPATMNFALGQANFLLLLLLAGTFWADSRSRMGLLGGMIAVAALIKVWMLGLLLYPLLRRRRRAVAVSAGAYGAGIVLLFTWAGWQEFKPFLQAIAATGQQISRISVTQSLYGFASLHLHANGLVDPLVSSGAAFGLFLLASVAALAWGLAPLWRHRALSPLEARLSLGLTAVSVLLLLPPCQNEYLVLCLPLLWTLVAPADAEAGRLSPWALAGGILAALIFSYPSPYAPVPPAYRHGLRSLLISLPFFGAAALWLTAALALRPPRAGGGESPETPGDRLPALTHAK